MKFLILLLVTLVVGGGFPGIHSQLSGFRPPWNPYFPIDPQPVVYYNSQQDFQRDYSRFLLDNEPVQEWPQSRSQDLSTKQKYFFVDNQAHVVHSVLPLSEPFSYLFNFNSYNDQPFAGLTRPAFARRTVSTSFKTFTSTIITPTINICVPSNMFATPSNVTTCNRRKRSINEADLLEVSPSPVAKIQVIPTHSVHPRVAMYEVESSKGMEDEPDIFFRQDKRFKIFRTETATVTVYSFVPTIIKKPISPVNNPLSGQTGVLLCIPPGIVVC